MKPAVVPEESERWMTVIAVLGSVTPGFSALIAGVVPGLDLAEVDVGERRAVELQAGLDAGQVVGDGDRARGTSGSGRRGCRSWRSLSSSAGFSGGSLAPKSTVLASSDGDARARADRLVVDRQAGLRRGPLLVDRRGERRAGARRSCPGAQLASCWTSWSCSRS